MRHNNYHRDTTLRLTMYELAGRLDHTNMDERVLFEIAVRLNKGRGRTVKFFNALLPAYGLTPEQVKAMFGF